MNLPPIISLKEGLAMLERGELKHPPAMAERIAQIDRGEIEFTEEVDRELLRMQGVDDGDSHCPVAEKWLAEAARRIVASREKVKGLDELVRPEPNEPSELLKHRYLCR